LQIIRISMLRSPTFMMGGELLVQKAKTEESRPGEGSLKATALTETFREVWGMD
jgi:hypothetical protein